jgi:K+-transporting ATPase KdpF subunit
MIAGVFGWAISGDDLIGIVMAVLLAAYLVFVLIKPEKL